MTAPPVHRHAPAGPETKQKKGVPERSEPESQASPVLELQRTIGNAAFQALLGAGKVPPPSMRTLPVQRDLVDDVRRMLTTSVIGQIVGVDQAIAALTRLATLDVGALTAAVTRMGRSAIDTLLDLLPEQRRRGNAFVSMLLALPEAWLDAYLATFPKGEALAFGQKTLLRDLFRACPDTRLALLKTIMSIRFNLAIGGATTAAAAGETAIDWEPLGLRRMYPVLEALPPAHVSANAQLISMGRYQGTGVSGYYWRQESAIGYDVPGLSDTQSSPGDPLHGVNRFDKVIRHEVGHAVDQQMGWAGSEAAKPERGGWTAHNANYGAVLTAMYAASPGGIMNLRRTRRNDLLAQLQWIMANRAPAQWAARVQALPWWPNVNQRTIDIINADPVVNAVRTGLRSPWYNHASGGIALGGRIYQESYANQWVSYAAAARARKVSQYQFRAPGEWFAEAYAAYYEPTPVRGAKLAGVDPNSKRYFDETVHTLGASR